MRAVVCAEYGSREALGLGTVPEPHAATGKVVLRVRNEM